MLGAWVAGTLLALSALPAGADEETQSAAGEAPNKIIAGLRQITGELTDSVKQFEAHLDREITLHDRGYRSTDGRRIPGADADILSGPADLALPTVQKLITARMISARRTGYEPASLTDCDRIQSLIAETRNRVAQSNNVMRQFLMISAKDLNSRTEVEAKGQRGELLKARNAATEAAKKALAILPVDLPDADSPEDQMDRTWSQTATALPVGKNDGTKVAAGMPQPMNTPDEVVLPIRVERGKKITLIHEAFRRVALVDPGMEDGQGRRLFYQEDWEQRQGATSVKRWAVAVNTTTGQQTLLRRYETREFPGELDEVYNSWGRVYLSRAKLPEMAGAPSLKDMALATLEASRSREELDDAVVSFKTRLREALARSDASLDDELPDNFRQTLFAIRGHLGRSEAILNCESEVRRAVDRVAQKAGALEALAAWANGTAIERETPEGDSRALLEALNRSDAEIASTRSAARDALKALPPDVSRPDAQFPAFMKDVIVRMRGTHSPAAPDGTVRCRQEVWRLDGSVKNMRRVKRTIDVVDIEPKTGTQKRASREMKYYPAGPGETLEGVFDENAAQ
jgi:hypothetical protein